MRLLGENPERPPHVLLRVMLARHANGALRARPAFIESAEHRQRPGGQCLRPDERAVADHLAAELWVTAGALDDFPEHSERLRQTTGREEPVRTARLDRDD